jgi:hypothetical protein
MYNVCHRPQSTALLGPSMSIAIMFLPSSPLFFLFLFWPVGRREGQQNSSDALWVFFLKEKSIR